MPIDHTTRDDATRLDTTRHDDGATIDPEAVAGALFEHLEQAWNRADGAAFGAEFAEDSDFVNIRGEHHRGDATSIGQAHQAIFDTIYAGSTVSYRLDVARVVAPGSIVAVATSTLDAPSGPLSGTNHSRMTAVLVEQQGRWVVTAFQNTLVVDDR